VSVLNAGVKFQVEVKIIKSKFIINKKEKEEEPTQ